MKITDNEILLLQDLVGNSSLSLKYLHGKIRKDITEETLLEIERIGQSLNNIIINILKTHKPLSFRRSK